MIIRLFFEGGAMFMSLVYLMWIIVIGLLIRFIMLYRAKKSPLQLQRTNNSILFFGSLAFLIGITGQMIGLMAAFDAIQTAGFGGVAPYQIAGGLKVSFIAPFFGLTLLLLSVIIWYVCRNLKGYTTQSESIAQE